MQPLLDNWIATHTGANCNHNIASECSGTKSPAASTCTCNLRFPVALPQRLQAPQQLRRRV